MADVSYSVSLRVSKGFLSNSVVTPSVTAAMSQVGMLSKTLTLASTTVSISTATLSSVGIGFFQNLATATIATAAIGIDSGGTFVEFCNLRPGEPAIMRLVPGADYQAHGGAGAIVRVDITEG